MADRGRTWTAELCPMSETTSDFEVSEKSVDFSELCDLSRRPHSEQEDAGSKRKLFSSPAGEYSTRANDLDSTTDCSPSLPSRPPRRDNLQSSSDRSHERTTTDRTHVTPRSLIPRPPASPQAPAPRKHRTQATATAEPPLDSATFPKASKQNTLVDVPRLIWQLEKNHAIESGRLQAEMKSLRRDMAALRDDVDRARPAPSQPCQKIAEVLSESRMMSGEVDQMRREMREVRAQSAASDRIARESSEAIACLRDELKRCSAEISASATACSRLLDKADDARTESIEQRVLSLEEAQMRGGSPPVHDAVVDMKAQVASLERHMHHLREQSSEVGRIAEQDQSALCAMLRVSRLLAEHIGVEIPRNLSTSGIAAEAESLAANVAASRRRQKVSGAIPVGSSHLFETIQISRPTSAQSPRPLSNSESPAIRPLSSRVSEPRDCGHSPSIIEDFSVPVDFDRTPRYSQGAPSLRYYDDER